MGNKLSAGKQVKRTPPTNGPASLIKAQEQQTGDHANDAALEAELRSAQEAALRIAAGVDILSQEIALEQQLAAIDDEAIGDDGVGGAGPLASGGDDEDADLDGLDPEELAELEGELQELEREVLGLELEDEGEGAAAGAVEATAAAADGDADGGEGAADGADAPGGEERAQAHAV